MAIYIDPQTQKQVEALHMKMPEPRPPLEDVDAAVAADGFEYYSKMSPEAAKLSILARAGLRRRKQA